MTIKNLVEIAHNNAKDKGFYERPSEVGTIISLIHSELGEATEAFRKNRRTLDHAFLKDYLTTGSEAHREFSSLVKDTVEDELADTVIRIADLCGYLGIDLESHVVAKLKFNKTRPLRHGKEF